MSRKSGKGLGLGEKHTPRRTPNPVKIGIARAKRLSTLSSQMSENNHVRINKCCLPARSLLHAFTKLLKTGACVRRAFKAAVVQLSGKRIGVKGIHPLTSGIRFKLSGIKYCGKVELYCNIQCRLLPVKGQLFGCSWR